MSVHLSFCPFSECLFIRLPCLTQSLITLPPSLPFSLFLFYLFNCLFTSSLAYHPVSLSSSFLSLSLSLYFLSFCIFSHLYSCFSDRRHFCYHQILLQTISFSRKVFIQKVLTFGKFVSSCREAKRPPTFVIFSHSLILLFIAFEKRAKN